MNGETIIDLTLQNGHPSRPLKDTWIRAGAAVTFRIVGLYVDGETDVTIVAFNADGVPRTISTARDGADFLATFPASHFAAYGSVSNGLRVMLVRDSEPFIAAAGNLVIEQVDASAIPGDPAAHLVTKEELSGLFDTMELADAATQKEVRVMLQQILSKLKGLASIALLLAAFTFPASSSALTAETAWEDMPPTSVVSQVVGQFSPPADLTPSTNYTDSATNALSGVLKAEVSSASQAGTNYTDAAVSGLAGDIQDGSLIAQNASEAEVARSLLGGGGVPVSGTELLEAIGDEHDANVNQDRDLRDLSASVAAVSNEAQVVYRLFSGSNVICEVTNYNSRVNPPTLSLMQLSESNTYFTVWAETNGLARTFNAATNDAAGRVQQSERRAADTYAPRAWSRTTSGLGEDAPTNTTWISTPTTVLAGGLEYKKIVHSSGEIWVLSGNGMVNFDPTTNAYLRISADDGTEIFSIEKTDAVTVGAFADGITVDNAGNVTIIEIPVNVVSSEHPKMYYRRELNDAAGWILEDYLDSALVWWNGRSGAWRCCIQMGSDSTANSGFFKFEYLKEGSTLIKNGAPMDVSGGIMCTDGIHKVRPVYSNGTVTWEVVQ